MEPMPEIRITAEDVLAVESPWQDCEIWDGIPMVCEPCGGRSSATAAEVVSDLGTFVREHDLGWFFGADQGFLLRRNPDRLLAPDAAYVSKERLAEIPLEGFIELAPDFVLEVRSPTQSWEATIAKCGIWQSHEVACTWAIDPQTRTVAVFRSGRDPQVLRGEGVADAAPALEGFTLDVAALFAAFDRPAEA